MKRTKKLTALLISAILLISTQMVFGLELTGTITENIPSIASTEGGSEALATTAWDANKAQMILENDKYIFVAVSNSSLTSCGVVQIYDKATGTLVKELSEATSNAYRYRPIRNMHIDGNTLYVTWGNGFNSGDSNAYILGTTMSPLKAYDVSNVTSDLTGKTVFTGGQRTSAHAPYILGNISYLDEENGLLYASQVMNKSYSRRYYRTYKTSQIDAVLGGETVSYENLEFYTEGISMNAAQFMIKDGYLYEVLQNKGGLSSYSCDATLVDSEGNAINNTVRIYNLNGVELTAEAQSVQSCLVGTYTTDVAGDKAIRDIEVMGNHLYVSTSAGIEVVDLTEALNAEETVTLAKEATITGNGGANDLDAIGGHLYAAFEGPQRYAGPNSNSEAGAVVIYDIAVSCDGTEIKATQQISYGALDISVNEGEGIVYVLNDTMGPPSMTAFGYSTEKPSFKPGFEFGAKVTENIPSLKNVNGGDDALSTTAWSANAGQFILENDKYIFVALSESSFTTCGVVQIIDKSTGEIVKELSEATDNAARYRPIRNMHIDGNTLYVTWGNGYSSGDATAYVKGTTMSPVKAYDVTNVTSDLTGTTIFTGGQRNATHAPYILGNISYLDEENGLLYTSEVMNKSYNLRYYYVYDTSEVDKALAGETVTYTKKRFRTSGLSMNTAKFMVKDGYLFEVLQNKGGLSSYPCDDTLVKTETVTGEDGETTTVTTSLNNMIRVYDLNSVTLTTTDQSVAGCLIGTYTTEATGDKAIRDIEVIGDNLYVSTINGVEVVSLTEAKKATEAVTLTADTILKDAGGARDLDAYGDYLLAAFEGPQIYSGPNSTSEEGSLVAYNTAENHTSTKQAVSYGAAEISINENEGVVYVLNDTKAPPSMTAYTFGTPVIKFVGENETSLDLKAGTFDISVDVVNEDSLSGTLVCGFYEGDRLSDVVVKTGVFVNNAKIAEDYEIGENITKVKVMYWSDLKNTLLPLTGAVKVEK